ncbi:hypothetical protein B6A10_16200 [Flavobacterium sp. L1I52]|uniref:Lipoprotein n=1 Tax=Flavobacterium pokkalii TaxID=1940408 RepID=A0ABR7UYM1_9FLAO|nr:hypothetical protein [Flavobacterium pokkalii]MBD0726713.1 hypothetical protein [Flavobacterium pokkalii]
MKRIKLFIPFLITLLLGCKSVTTRNSISSNTKTVPKYKKLNTFKGTTNDTLAYMRTSIISRKNKYIGKELNVLLNDLELPINNYAIGTSRAVGKDKSHSISLYFYPNNVVNLKRENRIDPVILHIYWETPLPKEMVLPILSKSKGIWTNDEKEYYGKQIIKDIGLTDYKFQ